LKFLKQMDLIKLINLFKNEIRVISCIKAGKLNEQEIYKDSFYKSADNHLDHIKQNLTFTIGDKKKVDEYIDYIIKKDHKIPDNILHRNVYDVNDIDFII